MTYIPTEAERKIDWLEAEVERVMGREFAMDLSNTYTDVMSEVEDRAVWHHGRAILAVIDGTTYAGPGSRSSRSRGESPLVRLHDGSVQA